METVLLFAGLMIVLCLGGICSMEALFALAACQLAVALVWFTSLYLRPDRLD